MIEDVRTAAVMVIGSNVATSDSVIRNVSPGNINTLQQGNPAVGPLGDGVLFIGATEEQALTLEDV